MPSPRNASARRFVAALSLIAGCAVLAGCAGSTPSTPVTSPASEPTSRETMPPPTVSPTASAILGDGVVSLYPCSSAAPRASRPSAAQLDTYRAVIQTGNTEPADRNACDPLTLILAATECCEPEAKADALADWGRRVYDPAMSWQFDIDPALLASWRAGPYAQFVAEGALIATNPDGRVTSILFDGDLITLLFVGGSELMVG